MVIAIGRELAKFRNHGVGALPFVDIDRLDWHASNAAGSVDLANDNVGGVAPRHSVGRARTGGKGEDAEIDFGGLASLRRSRRANRGEQ